VALAQLLKPVALWMRVLLALNSNENQSYKNQSL
jgi:hypothetical protein